MRNGAFDGIASFATISPAAIILHGREDLLKTMGHLGHISPLHREKWAQEFHDAYDSVACTEILQDSDGGAITWELADPCKLLQLTRERSPPRGLQHSHDAYRHTVGLTR